MKFVRLFILLFLMLSAGAAQATTLVYKAYGRGFHLLDVHVQYHLTPKTYEALTTTQTRGLLSLFLNSRDFFDSVGNIKNGTFVVDRSTFKNVQKKKERFFHIDFTGKKDMLDYTAAYFSSISQPQPRNQTYRVKDPAREMVVSLTYQGSVPPQRKVKVQAEDWELYTLSATVTSGKKVGWFFKRMEKTKKPIRAYFAKIQDVPERVLMLAEIDAGFFGTVALRLVGVYPDGMEAEEEIILIEEEDVEPSRDVVFKRF